MNARQLIATSIIAISAAAPAVALAGNTASDATSHVYTTETQRDQTSRQAVLNAYQEAVKSGEFSPIAGDQTKSAEVKLSNTSRADVLSMIKGANLTEGDAS